MYLYTNIMKLDFKLRYAAAAMTYGAIRKAIIIKDAKIYEYKYDSKDYKEYPLLNTQKALLVATGALANIYTWPFYAITDCCTIESHTRGLEKTNYNLFCPDEKPRSVLHYFLA